MNSIVITGDVGEVKEVNTREYGRCYEFFVSAVRLSGTVDTLKCLAPARIFHDNPEGKHLTLYGEIRTRNEYEGERRKLLLYVNVSSAAECEEKRKYENTVTLRGFICSKVNTHLTSSVGAVSNSLVACNSNKNTYYIPVVFFKGGSRVVRNAKKGTEISVTGMLTSRHYKKHDENGDVITEADTYEIVTSIVFLEKWREKNADQASEIK